MHAFKFSNDICLIEKYEKYDQMCWELGLDGLSIDQQAWPYHGDKSYCTRAEKHCSALDRLPPVPAPPMVDTPKLEELFEFGFDVRTPPAMSPFDADDTSYDASHEATPHLAPEAVKTELKNSSFPAQQIKPETDLSGPSVIVQNYYAYQNSFMTPEPSKKTRTKKVKSESGKPKVIQPKKKRVTIEQSFVNVLAHQIDARGWYWFHKAKADQVWSDVVNGQVKISDAGAKGNGKSPKRSGYTKIHDHLSKCKPKWIREVVGEIVYYHK